MQIHLLVTGGEDSKINIWRSPSPGGPSMEVDESSDDDSQDSSSRKRGGGGDDDSVSSSVLYFDEPLLTFALVQGFKRMRTD